MKLTRLLPLLIPVAVFALDEIYFFNPKLIFLSAVLIVLLLFFTLWQFSRLSTVDKQWWNYLILPALVSCAVIAYSVFLSAKPVIQLLFVLNLVFLYSYSRHVFYYLLEPRSYQAFSIENISSSADWLGFWLAAAVIYGLQSFLNWPTSWLVLAMAAVAALLVYQIVWVNKIDFKAGLPYILISCLILVELAWSVSFLPFNYNIAGLLLAICFYVITGLVKNYLLLKLDSSKVKMYLILGGASLLVILFTARWL